MAPPTHRLMRSLATFGIAIFGPLALISGLAVLVTMIAGTPALLLGLFLFSLPAAVVAVLLYMLADIRERNES